MQGRLVRLPLCGNVSNLLYGAWKRRSEQAGDWAISSPAELKASDYFDEIRYVPLETRDDCLVGSSPDIKLLDKYILITSANRQCLLFDKATGKFKCQIGHVGKDPGGYRNVDCLVDELNGRLLFNGWGHDLISYNLDGNYIGKIELLIFLRKYSWG